MFEQAPDLVVHGLLLLGRQLLVVFQTVEPQAEDDHQVQAAEGVLDAPVGGRGPGHPPDALQRDRLEAVVALLDDLDHLAGPLDPVPRVRHGGGDLEGVVVAQRLLDRLEVDLEAGAGVAEHGHGVEDQGVALVGRAQGDGHGLRLAEVQRPLPRLQGQAELVLRHDVLERLGAALVVPHLEEEGVDHGAGRERAVPPRLALEEVVVGLHEGRGPGRRELLGPRRLVDDVQVPHGLGRRQLQVLELVEADGGGVVEGERQQAEEDVHGVVRAPAALVLHPLGAGGLVAAAGLGAQLQLVAVAGHHVGEQALDGAGPLQALGVAAPAGEDHVQQGALHGPQRALARAEVLLVLQELVDQHLGPDVQHVRLVLVEGVQGADRQHREEQRRRHLRGRERRRVQEGQVVVEEAEVRREVPVQGRQAGQAEAVGDGALAVVAPDVVEDGVAVLVADDLGRPQRRVGRREGSQALRGRPLHGRGALGGRRGGHGLEVLDGRQLVRVRLRLRGGQARGEGRLRLLGAGRGRGDGVRLGLGDRLRHELVPRHLRQRDGARGVGDGGLEERGARREGHSGSGLVGADARVAHGRRGLVVEVGHQHRGRLEVHHAVAAGLDLLQGGGVDGRDGRLGGPGQGRGLGAGAALHVAVEGDAAVLGVDGAVVSQQQVASHEGTSTLHALEGAFLGVWDVVSIRIAHVFWSSRREGRGVIFSLGMCTRADGRRGATQPRAKNTYGISHGDCDARSG